MRQVNENKVISWRYEEPEAKIKQNQQYIPHTLMTPTQKSRQNLSETEVNGETLECAPGQASLQRDLLGASLLST